MLEQMKILARSKLVNGPIHLFAGDTLQVQYIYADESGKIAETLCTTTLCERHAMAYFSNGTEGESYFEHYCSRCLHDNEAKEIHCPIWNLHLMHNAKGANDKEHFLHALIPRGKDGGNERCAMFVYRGLLSNLQIEKYEHERT